LVLVGLGVGSLGACAASTGESGQESTQALTACDASGTWALKIAQPVKWPATFVLQAGSGTITNFARSSRVQTGTDIKDTARICGINIPSYQATASFGSEKYGVAFPDAAYDAAAMPTLNFGATVSSAEIGATFTSGAVAALIGATMPNAASDPWPSNLTALVPVDSDGDGKPGISGDALQGPGLFNPPVNAFRTARANRVYTAFRQVMTATGTVKSCSRIEGTGTIAVINNKPAIDQHVLGCRKVDGNECGASEYKLLDGAAPTYTPDGTAVITMVKVPDATTCTDIRAMSFDADPVVTDGGTSTSSDASSGPGPVVTGGGAH
jgi:hypothetical protein